MKKTYKYSPVHFPSNSHAVKALDELQNMAKEYGVVSVADLYDICGLTRTKQDEEYGWPEDIIMGAFIVSESTDSAVCKDYIIKLPPPMRLTCESEIEPIDSTGMPHDIFKSLLEELDGNSVKTLFEKNSRYSQNGDALSHFRSAADVAGGTPAQACWGYMTKHLVALRDMVEKDNFSNREDFLEKCQDTINYIRFLWCIGNDTNKKQKGE